MTQAAAQQQPQQEQRKPGSLFDNRQREAAEPVTPAPAQPAAAQPAQDDYSPRHSYEPRAGQERERYTPQRPAEERRPESSGLFTNSDRFSREERRDDYRLSRPSQRRDDDGDDDLDVPSFMR